MQVSDNQRNLIKWGCPISDTLFGFECPIKDIVAILRFVLDDTFGKIAKKEEIFSSKLIEFFYLCICSTLKSNVNGTDTGLFQFSQSFAGHEGT